MESLYFVAVVPPLDIREQITSFKRYCAENFGSKHALRSPPHITLHMPFKWKDKKIPALCDHLASVASEASDFEVILQNFDFFVPRVIFVDVLDSAALRDLQSRVAAQLRRLQVFNATHKDKGFHPHVTIAFRDLKRSIFQEAQAHFASLSYGACFQVDHLVLLKHDQHKWSEFQRFYFT